MADIFIQSIHFPQLPVKFPLPDFPCQSNFNSFFSFFLHALQEPCFMMHSSLIFVTLGTKLISQGHVS